MVDKAAAVRLSAARKARGYRTAKEFADKHDIPQPTYAMHETAERGLRRDVAERYATLLEVPVEWLMFGRGNPFPPEPEFDPDISLAPEKPGAGMAVIEEFETGGGMAEGGQVDPYTSVQSGHKVVAHWQLPEEVVRSATPAPFDKIKIIRAVGESNKPEIQPGERLMIDTADTIPSPPGFFAVWDGLGEVIKRVEFVPYSQPKRVVFLSANPAYKPREYLLADIVINGRVIGRWDRL